MDSNLLYKIEFCEIYQISELMIEWIEDIISIKIMKTKGKYNDPDTFVCEPPHLRI